MKRIEPEYKDIKFDRFNRHHIMLHGKGDWGSPAVLFVDTHEFMYMSSNARPEYRRDVWYGKQSLGMRIMGTTDGAADRYDFKLPTGEKIPKTYLNRHGMHDVLIDEDTGYVVPLANHYREGKNKDELKAACDLAMPQWIRHHAQIYISGPGELPVGPPIPIYPTRSVEKARRTHVNDLIAASKAWYALDDKLAALVSTAETFDVHDKKLDVDFGELDKFTRLRLARMGVETRYDTVYLPHLLV